MLNNPFQQIWKDLRSKPQWIFECQPEKVLCLMIGYYETFFNIQTIAISLKLQYTNWENILQTHVNEFNQNTTN